MVSWIGPAQPCMWNVDRVTRGAIPNVSNIAGIDENGPKYKNAMKC